MSIFSRFSRALKYAAPGLLACSMLTAPAAAQGGDVNQLKAAIVLNVLRFIDFPADSRGPIDFCVAANAGLTSSFGAFSGRQAGSRTVSVRAVRSGSFEGCDVVYLDANNAQFMARAVGDGRLVMGDGRSFIDHGGTVGLVQMGGQVRFELNLDAAGRANLTISSKLIRLAARVAR